MKKLLTSAAIAIGVAFGSAGSAQALPQVAVYLTMDGSGSIDASEFSTQVSAYNAALNAVFTGNPALYGQVAIGAGIFGRDFSEFFAVQEITDSTTLGNLTSAISALITGMPARDGIDTSSTAIGDAITASANSLTTYAGTSGMKLIIDVTTDGQSLTGSDPVTVAAGLTPSPIDAINCLGIGTGADCSFVTTAGSGQIFGAATFADLEAALTAKLQIETQVPEATTLALVGLGLLGLGVASRRRKAA